jgi:putative acetyltransferase
MSQGIADDLTIAVEDPRAEDVHALLEAHIDFARATSPPEHVHALKPDGLLEPGLTLYGARRGGVLLGVGALREVNADHAEIKSMHTAKASRGQGVGRVIVDHLLGVARLECYRRVSLETGTMDEFAPARSLYERVGFVTCAPFGIYTDNPYSTCMTIEL